MKAILGDYILETDNYNFIVKRVDTVEVKNEEKEVIGTKEVEKVVGYSTNLDTALKLIVNRVLLDNDDLKDICKILRTLSIKIGGIRATLDQVVEERDS